MSDNPIILVFVKSPVKGAVKSRLAAAVGEEAALDLYRNFILDIVDTVIKSGFPFALCFYPPDAGGTVASWIGSQHRLIPQDGADLGSRMENAFRRAFSEGFTRALLIGSDIPDLVPVVFQEAFGSLERNDAVIGKAADGGYYLIGFKADTFAPRIFHGISWSTSTVFRETMTLLHEASLRVHQVHQWRDVDTVEDLRSLFARNTGRDNGPRRTMAYLAHHKDRLFPEDD